MGLLLAAALTAGCGGSLSGRSSAGSDVPRVNGSTTPKGTSNPETKPSALAFSNCIRANGVPNFPDLSSNGMKIEGNGQTMSVNGVSVEAPAFLAARRECRKYLPHQQATLAQAAQQRQRGLDFAKCMRTHGVPNFPDPRYITGAGGQQEAYLPGVNPQSPAFQAAAKACGGGPKGP